MKTVRKLKSMNYAGVRKNLEFHHVKDKKVSLHGTVDDMVKRLRKLLKTRCVDYIVSIMNLTGASQGD